ncbi:MAG: RecQ family zinc-binding domain-containing protein, partial [Treponema sp.]|nr:RecQ family zinc-binding domain-containing protein [Treponema sp.]
AGRAGRDGAQSKAILLWGPDDIAGLRRAKTGADRARLSGLLDYARDVTKCRRQALLRMLDYDSGGESPETQCCDVCEGQASAALREEKSVMRFFARNVRRFTVNEAASVLARAEKHRWSQDEARQVINHLFNEKRLKKSRNFLWKGALSLAR